ncbi:hypothetical protein SUGI_0850360 [Cryptomeria japonica]|nr:hypothetical protein SUGI_0850360 [Cryptomeria japonica]
MLKSTRNTVPTLILSSLPKAAKDCLVAYSQTWEKIDFIEETDKEADGITSQAAERYFGVLQRKLKNGHLLARKFRYATPGCVRPALDNLKK